MKFRYFLTLIASVLVFAGCMQESIDSFESIKLDKTYLTIPETGGEVELTITATQDWNFVETEMWPRVIAYQKDSNGKEIKDEDGNKVIDESKTVPSWLTLKGEMSGKAGETKVVFAAEPTNGGREIELSIKAGNNVQYFRVRQGTMLASDATCAEVIAGVDGKSYRVQGVCTSIANDYYGNFYLNDGTGEIYIYGTKDGDGQYNWDDFNIEVGDSVKVEGPRKDYNGTIELVDALFIKVIKSLIKLVEPTDKMVSEEGETFDVKLAYKGKGVFYTVADECSSWVKIEGMTSKSGEPTKLEPNPADTAIVTVTVAPYDEPSSRTGSIEFSSSLDDAKSVITFAFRQGVAEVSVADFLEKEVGDTPYKLTGKIANLNNTTYGNFDLVDATGSIYVYGLTATKVASNDKSFSTLGLREGDIVTIIGTRGEHKEVPQVAGPAYYVSHIGSTDITVKEFLEKEKSKDVWYRLTGKVTSLKPGEYGNFHLVDETGSVYVYGLTKAPVAKNDKSFPTLGVKEGDIVTLVGTRDRYNDAKVPEEKEQVGGPAYYISHEAGDAPAVPGPKSMTIAEAVAQTDSVLVSGTVMALCAKGFILQDESGIAFIYDSGYSQTYVVGDQVKVGGKPGAYNYANQITPNAKYYEKTGSVEVTYPDPVVLNAAKVAEMKDGAGEDKNVGVYNPFYITVEGTVRVSGTYFNLDIDGVETSTAQGSFYQLTDAQKEELTALKDKAVVLTGYFQSISQSGGVPKFFNVIYLTVEEKEAEGGEEPTEKAARNLAFSAATASATLGQDFTAPTLSGETDGVAYSSSNTAVATVDAATGAVTLVAAGETTITATAEETETLQAGTASYVLTVSAAEVVGPEFEAGQYWIVDDGFVGTPELKSGTYGYMIAEEAWKSSTGVSSTEANAFTFEVAEGGYTIKDSKGRYLYSGKKDDGTYYNTFNASATATENHIWTVAKNADGTYKITNKASTFDVHFGASFKTFECVANVTDFPELLKVENAVPAVEIPESLEIVGAGETKTITLPEGVTVTPTCDNEAFSVSAAANVVTISAESAAEAKSGTLTLALAYNGFSITKTIAISQKAATDTSVTEVISGTFTYDESAKALKLTTTSGITITQAIASGSTAVNKNYNTAQTLRVYKGHKLTFSGKIFKKIIFEHASNYAGNSVTASGGTYTPGSTSSEWSGSEDNVVITNTGTAANVQLRPTKITVIY